MPESNNKPHQWGPDNNRHVAHSEAPLDDPEKAVEAMGEWVRCISRMVKIAG